MARVNILKQVKVDDRWRLVAIPRKSSGDYEWTALPEGRYYVEWRERGKRKREAGGSTVAEAQQVARRRRHVLEGRALGLIKESEEEKKGVLQIAAKHYLDSIEALKKINTYRKYKSVIDRFVEFMPPGIDPKKVTREDLTDFMVRLRNKHRLDNNTVIHHLIIVAHFLKRHGKGGITKDIGMPERIVTLPEEYGDADLKKFFDSCTEPERALFATFLYTGFREQEVVHLSWPDVNFKLNTVRVTLKLELGFSPKRWEEREVPVVKGLIDLLAAHPRRPKCQFVFPSPAGNREWNMLLRCKAIAKRAGLDEGKFDLKTFRSTFATRMLRASFDVRTVQHWMGHRQTARSDPYAARYVPAAEGDPPHGGAERKSNRFRVHHERT